MDSKLGLAREWWALHEPGGVFATSDDSFSEEVVDRAFEVENEVREMVADRNRLGALLEALVATAPRPSLIPYIGTFHLENAYDSLGDGALQTLEATQLAKEIKEAILSGFDY